MNEALQDLWQAIKPGIPFNAEFGICKYWLANYKTLGSPVGVEHKDAKSGVVYQAFANGIVRWDGKATLL